MFKSSFAAASVYVVVFSCRERFIILNSLQIYDSSSDKCIYQSMNHIFLNKFKTMKNSRHKSTAKTHHPHWVIKWVNVHQLMSTFHRAYQCGTLTDFIWIGRFMFHELLLDACMEHCFVNNTDKTISYLQKRIMNFLFVLLGFHPSQNKKNNNEKNIPTHLCVFWSEITSRSLHWDWANIRFSFWSFA